MGRSPKTGALALSRIMPPCGISALRASGAAARWYAACIAMIIRARRAARRAMPRATPPSLSAIRHSAVWRDELPDALILWRAIVVGWLGRSSCEIIAIALRAMRRCLWLPEKKKVRGATYRLVCRALRSYGGVRIGLPTNEPPRHSADTRRPKGRFRGTPPPLVWGLGRSPKGSRDHPCKEGKASLSHTCLSFYDMVISEEESSSNPRTMRV